MDWVSKQVKRAASSVSAVASGSNDDFVGRIAEMPGGNSVKVRKSIAEGGFGIVYLAQNTKTGDAFALKRLLGSEKEHRDLIVKEVACMKRLSSPGHNNIIRLVDVRENRAEFLLLMELCDGGTLANVIEQHKFSVSEVLTTMHQCTSAIHFMHQMSPPIIHRDIKLENFLLTRDGTVKLCDFGSVTTRVINPATMAFKDISMASEEMQRNTTPMNRTPEMLQMSDAHGKIVGLAGDLWALGTTLYMLCFRVHPFPDGAILAITNAKFQLPLKSDYDPLIPMLRALLSIDPASRPTASGIMQQIIQLAQSGIPKADLKRLIKSGGDAPSPTASGGSFYSRARDGALAKASNLVKSAKKRLQNDDTKIHGGAAGDLDLTYVCPRIIAMASPGEGLTARNELSEVATFLGRAHPGHACVFDLADKPNYDNTKLGCEYKQCSLPGALSSPPKLNTLYVICTAIQDWLLANRKNVAVIHCSTGKEVTGTIISAYMAFCQLTSAAAAVRLYHLKRMFDGKGVVSPSQLRYVSYISQIANSKLPHKRTLKISRLLLKSVPKFKLNSKAVGCRPYVEVYLNGELLKSTKNNQRGANDGVYTAGVETSIEIPIDVESRCGNLAVVCYHEYFSLIGHGSAVEMFSFYCHTGFMKDNGFTLKCHELDVQGKHRNKFDDGFMVRMECQILNKQSKKDAPWEKDPPKSKLETDLTFFFDQKERDVFMHDLDHSMRSLTENSVSSAVSMDSMSHISDDEEEMHDATPMTTPPVSAAFDGRSSVSNDMQQVTGPGNFDLLGGADDLFGGNTSSSGPSSTAVSPPPTLSGGFDLLSEETVATPIATPSAGLNDDLFGLSLGGDTNTASTASLATPAQPSVTTAERSPLMDFSSPAKPTNTATTSSMGSSDLLGDLFGGPPAAPTVVPAQASVTPAAAATESAPVDLFSGLGFGSTGSNSVNGGSVVGGPTASMNSMSASMPTPMQPSQPPSTKSVNSFDLLGGSGTNPLSAQQKSSSVQDMFSDMAQPMQSTIPEPSRTVSGPSNTFSMSGASFGSSSGPASSASNTAAKSSSASSAGASAGSSSRASSFKKSNGGDPFGSFNPFAGKEKAEKETMNSKLIKERIKNNEDPDAIKVEMWARGKKNNIRSILASLQDILWDEAKTQIPNVTVGDLFESGQVKKAYRKTGLILHPDKRNNKVPEESRNLAKHLWDEISEAHRQWREEGEQ